MSAHCERGTTGILAPTIQPLSTFYMIDLMSISKADLLLPTFGSIPGDNFKPSLSVALLTVQAAQQSVDDGSLVLLCTLSAQQCPAGRRPLKSIGSSAVLVLCQSLHCATEILKSNMSC